MFLFIIQTDFEDKWDAFSFFLHPLSKQSNANVNSDRKIKFQVIGFGSIVARWCNCHASLITYYSDFTSSNRVCELIISTYIVILYPYLLIRISRYGFIHARITVLLPNYMHCCCYYHNVRYLSCGILLSVFCFNIFAIFCVWNIHLE